MECGILFYTARKTSFCERALKKRLSEHMLITKSVSFASDCKALGKKLGEDFERLNIVFVIGGLGFTDGRNIASILSRAIDFDVDEVKKLKNSSGDDGYLIKKGRQLLILLPDEPAQIEEIMSGPISSYIKRNLSVNA